MKSLIILGRQPALGLAELESLFGAQALRPISGQSVILDIDADAIPFSRLGGSIKVARVLTELPTVKWSELEEFTAQTIPAHLTYLDEGKLRLGLSVYGIQASVKQINQTGLKLKKIIRAEGRGVRVVPNKSPALNSAQVLHNKLAGANGWELLFVRYKSKTILAQTFAEQDIESYARRDQNRPHRDARVGMLPPKLAQVIINMAEPASGNTILDPFCGTGVILQEALLMGFNAYGTDLEPRMIEYSRKNIDWLREKKIINGTEQIRYEVTDATSGLWPYPFDRVAGETYLGKPLSKLPPDDLLKAIVDECDYIHSKFLNNIGNQMSSATKLCIAVPAWKTTNGFLHLKTLDKLEDLGYTRKSFAFARNEELIYHRPGQTVARELVVLEKN